MANPQKEDGYTPIANEIIEHLIKLPLNGTQWRIITVIWRYTYGFSRKEHEISEGFIVKASGISKRFVASELKKLIYWNIIKVVRKSTYTKPKILAFNKDFDTWTCRTNSLQVKDCLTGEVKGTSTVEGLFYSTGEGLFNQENKYKTNTKTKGINDFFESIWKLYPLKRGKAQVKAATKKRLYDIGIEEMTRAISRYKDGLLQEDWRKPQNGSTFFNSGYEDYLDSNYTQPAMDKPQNAYSGYPDID